jgi:asparagine synthetase B (glutamine-hydrolysing)
MTVDSEAIFAVAAHAENDASALEDLRGAMATAWLDEREPDVLFLARGMGRPLLLGEGRDGVFFASTKLALEVVERYCRVRLHKVEVREGTLCALRDGKIVRRDRFRPDMSFVEDDPLPPVRAPGEREFCLTRLASIAAAA